MKNTFFISDTHFGHEAIIRYEKRPFSSVEEMDETIIQNWNKTVGKEDTVVFAGDFALYPKEKTAELVNRLNGHKIIILGNHDRKHDVQWWRDVGFEEVSRFPIVFQEFYIVSHEPLYMNDSMPYVNVHGHIHGLKYEGNKHINICVEHWNYTPIPFETIAQIAAGK